MEYINSISWFFILTLTNCLVSYFIVMRYMFKYIMSTKKTWRDTYFKTSTLLVIITGLFILYIYNFH